MIKESSSTIGKSHPVHNYIPKYRGLGSLWLTEEEQGRVLKSTHDILRYILYLYITTIPTTIDLAEYPFIYI